MKASVLLFDPEIYHMQIPILMFLNPKQIFFCREELKNRFGCLTKLKNRKSVRIKTPNNETTTNNLRKRF